MGDLRPAAHRGSVRRGAPRRDPRSDRIRRACNAVGGNDIDGAGGVTHPPFVRRSLTSTGAVRTFLRLAYGTHLAQVAELVDALVSGTSGAIRGGSRTLLGTTASIPFFFRN